MTLRRPGEFVLVHGASHGCAARLGVTPIDMPTAHDPMLSDPDGLVTILDGFAR